MAMSASEVLISKFLQDVEENGTFSWQRPYEVMTPFNWLTMKPYRGFNRILLPMGEYLTRNQLNQINKDMGWDYRFQKGIKWWDITFFKKDKRVVRPEEITEKFGELPTEPGFIGKDMPWTYFLGADNSFYKQRNVLQYYQVFDVKFLKNSEGKDFPSRVKTGEIEFTYRKPQEVFDSYIERTGINLDTTSTDVPCYIPRFDVIQLNKNVVSEDAYWSTAFHECGHSTGAVNRLNREGVVHVNKVNKEVYAVEECIAEICAGLCCSECGIYTFSTTESREYENNLAYVQAYKKRIKDWGSKFIFIASQAEDAFNYIMGYDED